MKHLDKYFFYVDGTKERFNYLKSKRSPTQEIFDKVNSEDTRLKIGDFVGDEMIIAIISGRIKLKNILNPHGASRWV